MTPRKTMTRELDDLLIISPDCDNCFCLSSPRANLSESSSKNGRFLWQGVNYIDNLTLVGARSTTRYIIRHLLCTAEITR